MDVESLFPSLKTNDCEKRVKETVLNSDLFIDVEDTKELAIFLRKHMSNRDIEECGLCDLIPERKTKLKNQVKNVHEDPWIFSKISTDDSDNYFLKLWESQ